MYILIDMTRAAILQVMSLLIGRNYDDDDDDVMLMMVMMMVYL